MLTEKDLNQLDKANSDDTKKILSLYLNVDPRDPEQEGDKWKIKLKKILTQLEEDTKDSDSHEEKNQAKALQEKVENHIYGKANKFKRGLVLFATADGDLWLSIDLNIPVTTESYWNNKAQTDQLTTIQNQYPYTGILILQQDQAQLIETELKEELDSFYYKLDLNTDDWRQHQGPQGDDWTKGGAQRDEYKDRVKANQERWLRSLAQTVQKKAQQLNWKQFYLVGEKGEVEQLRGYFDQKIDKVVPKNLLGRNANNIIEEALDE